MEVKKTFNADLEHRRPAWFLMGLVMALALFVVALEYSYQEKGGLLDEDFLDEIAEDMELMPPMENQFIEEIETPVSNQSDLLEVVEEAEALKDQTEENIEQTPELVTEEEVVEDDKEDERVEPETLEEKKEEVRHMNEVDELPIFPGGNAQLVKWLSSNLKYPESAKNEKVGGKVVVEFVVNANGTVSDIQLNKKVDDRLDGEALRVVRMMPNWKAGILGGRPCRTLVRLPIVFKL